MTCFFLGKQGEEKVTADDAFRIVRDSWNEYYDCMEKLIAYLLDLVEAENGKVRYPGDLIEYLEKKCAQHGFNFVRELEEKFGVEFYFGDLRYICYDQEQRKIRRERWLEAKTLEKAVAFNVADPFTEGDICLYGLLEGMKKVLVPFWGHIMDNKKAREWCEQCQMVIDIRGCVPSDLCDRIEARGLHYCYHAEG